MNSTLINTHQKGSCLNPDFKEDSIQNWYIFYTAPRAEKVVYNELLFKDYDAFLPTVKTLRVWKNRQRKWIEQVLFPSYIFVFTKESEIYNIKRTPKIAACISCGSKPSIIPIKDMEGIKKMLSLDQDVSVETNYYEGEKVRIAYGPLAGYEGVLVQQKGKKRFGIQLKEINQTVFIEISSSLLEKIPQTG